MTDALNALLFLLLGTIMGMTVFYIFIMPAYTKRLFWRLPVKETEKERRCLECGGPLVKSKFVDEWNLDGSPVEVVEDWYCPSCKIRWVHLYDDEPVKEAKGWRE